MTDLYCKTHSKLIRTLIELTMIASDSMAFMDSMDPTFSTFFGEEDSKDSWVFSQPTSFGT